MGGKPKPMTDEQVQALATTMRGLEDRVETFLLTHEFKMEELTQDPRFEPDMGFCISDYFQSITGERRIAATPATLTALNRCFEQFGWIRVQVRSSTQKKRIRIYRKLRADRDHLELAIKKIKTFLDINPTHAALPLESKYVSRLGFTAETLTTQVLSQHELATHEGLQVSVDAYLASVGWLRTNISLAGTPVSVYRKTRSAEEAELAYAVERHLGTRPKYPDLRGCAKYEDDIGFTYEQLATVALRRHVGSLTAAESNCIHQVVSDLGWVKLRTCNTQGRQVRVFRKLKDSNK
jgi:hypothetical protein